MTLDEALEAAVLGERVTSDTLQPGAWIEYNFAGWRKEWPSGSGCDFRPDDRDRAAEWRIVGACEKCGSHIKPVEDDMAGRCACPPPQMKGGWGSLKPATSNTPEYIAAVDKLIGAKPAAPPIADVIELPGVVSREQAERAALPVWAPKKALDPNKGGW